MAPDNMYRKFREVWMCDLVIMRADGQTRCAHHNTLHLYRGQSNDSST